MLKIFLVLENLAEPNCTENLTLKNLRFVPFGGQPDIPGVPSQDQGCQIWHLNWIKLAPYGTNLGLFNISFSTFWRGAPGTSSLGPQWDRLTPKWDKSETLSQSVQKTS